MFYTYGDELTPKEAMKNLEAFGKVVSTFLVVWGLKSAISYAIDVPRSDLTPKDSQCTKDMTPADLTPPVPSDKPLAPAPTGKGNSAFKNRPPGPNAPVFAPYVPPSSSIACNPFFAGVGLIAILWTCSAAVLLNNRQLYVACVGLLSYLTGGATEPHK